MNFTAHGYARLTDLLEPDIVVLEGGYSIEGALPYVNVGILLALAGLDYSAVREPDWSPGVARQPRGVTEEIRRLTGTLQEMWASREEADIGVLFGDGEYFERGRRIYYDTDNIVEQQREQIRLCPSCQRMAGNILSCAPCLNRKNGSNRCDAGSVAGMCRLQGNRP